MEDFGKCTKVKLILYFEFLKIFQEVTKLPTALTTAA